MIGKTNPRARSLRRDATHAETLLWRHLRNRQLNGLKFRRQVTIGPFIADFACMEARLVVEADGGQHNQRDETRRTQYLETRGYRVIRFWNNDIMSNIDGVVAAISLVASEQCAPSPNPLPRAGEGY